MHDFRVAFIVGALGQGGAEKQLVYMADALQRAGARVKIFCLTRGEYFEETLQKKNLLPVWVGKYSSPPVRLLRLAWDISTFAPHIVQSSHFFTNLYTGLLAPVFGAIGIGCLRSDAINEIDKNRHWSNSLLHMPRAIISNSNAARQTAISLGLRSDRVFVLPNVIDLDSFDEQVLDPLRGQTEMRKSDQWVNVVTVGNLYPVKRFDRFLRGLQKARKEDPRIRGFIIGDGPEKLNLENMAGDLGLSKEGVQFLGQVDHVPAYLHQADIFVLTSEHEGFPNVILEAMAARLPVIAPLVGDTGIIIENGETGWIIPMENTDLLASKMIELAKVPKLRQQYGLSGRKRVEQVYNENLLKNRLLEIYKQLSQNEKYYHILEAINSLNQPV